MPTASQTPPISYAGSVTAGLTQSYVFAAEEMQLAMMESNDLTADVPLVGDIAGSGSDTIRTSYADDVSYARRASALNTETSAPQPASITYGYDAITGGFYGFADESTLKGLVLLAPGRSLDLRQLAVLAPGTVIATRRYLYCVAGATISASVGSASVKASVDTMLDLVALRNQTAGAREQGGITLVAHSVTLSHLQASARTEPAFQNTAMDFSSIQGARDQYEIPNFLGLGINFRDTADVQNSGGAYQNFAGSRGFIGRVTASFSGVVSNLPEGVRNMVTPVDAIGGIMYPRLNDMTSQVFGHNLIFVAGFAPAAADRRFQVRVLDKMT